MRTACACPKIPCSRARQQGTEAGLAVPVDATLTFALGLGRMWPPPADLMNIGWAVGVSRILYRKGPARLHTRHTKA